MVMRVLETMPDVLGRIMRVHSANYDQSFWHTIAHGDKCCCVLKDPSPCAHGYWFGHCPICSRGDQ